jgi:hypothetical protein
VQDEHLALSASAAAQDDVRVAGSLALKVAEEANQDNEWDGYAQEQQQNGTHRLISLLTLVK